jgi:hypothetical protein
MTGRTDIELVLDRYLAEGSETVADRALQQALDEIDRTPQRRGPLAPWRFPAMINPVRLATALAVAVIALAGAAYFLGPGIGSRPQTPFVSPQLSPAPTPTMVALGSVEPGWTTYASERYGFVIGHPVDWSELPSTRAWTFDRDTDATAPVSGGAEHFTSPDGSVRVSAWDVPLESPVNLDSRDELLSWITSYCTRTGGGGCSDITDRAVFFCNERRDCHNAYLVPFDDWVGAFAWGGTIDGTVRIVAIWRAENEPEVAPYGGARSLLEAFLRTMNIVPATPEQANGTAP